ncbi:MAG: hypothetical protein AAF050_14640 [Cyanobacteria bacterium J06649_5]
MFGLPWPQKALTQESEAPAENDLVFDSVSAISTARLPADRLPSAVNQDPSATGENHSSAADTLDSFPKSLSGSVTSPGPVASPDSGTSSGTSLERSHPIQPIPAPQIIEPVIQPQPLEQAVPEMDLAASAPLQPLSSDPVDPQISAEPELNSSLDNEPEYGAVIALGEEFPHLAEAQSGCYGLEGCQQLSGNYRRAAQQLIEQMESQGYQLTKRDDLDDTGHRVFEVIAPSEPEKTYYLNVFSPDAGSTVYVLAIDILSLTELQQLSS